MLITVFVEKTAGSPDVEPKVCVMTWNSPEPGEPVDVDLLETVQWGQQEADEFEIDGFLYHLTTAREDFGQMRMVRFIEHTRH